MKFKVVLFDLGGVLVELGAFPVNKNWLGSMSVAELSKKWLDYPVARQYECGQIDEHEFRSRIIEEIPLNTSAEEFISAFRAWPKQLYPGVLVLLAELSNRYTIACLSNTNTSHWDRVMDEMKLMNAFHHEFASFKLGMVKPDREIYEFVSQQLRVKPKDILFMDDNKNNIDMALKCGYTAVQTQGIEQVNSVLKQFKLLT